MIPPKYIKEMPGAELTFRPENQLDYQDEAWDIRITLGNAPLDEAFFITIESYSDSFRSIRELLDEIALNPEREDKLNTTEYPDLPFLQQELIQYWLAEKSQQLPLSVFVNNHPEPIDLDRPAKDFLAACTFRNKSWDYLVLDLIFEATATIGTPEGKEAFFQQYADILNSPGNKEEARTLARQYERYASVSVAPCALGVPDGFDVRLQMMELDGLNLERCLLINLLAEQDAVPGNIYEQVCEALAFKTHFSLEILRELKACGEIFENA